MQTIAVPNHVIIPQIAAQLRTGRSVIIRVKGNSMQPFLEDERDKVLLSPLAVKTLEVGDLILAETTPKHYVLHRIVRIAGSTITMQGDGNVNMTETFDASQVIGVVTAFFRKGRDKKSESIYDYKWQTYSKLWMTLTPLRRWLLAFYRRVWLKIFPSH